MLISLHSPPSAWGPWRTIQYTTANTTTYSSSPVRSNPLIRYVIQRHHFRRNPKRICRYRWSTRHAVYLSRSLPQPHVQRICLRHTLKSQPPIIYSTSTSMSHLLAQIIRAHTPSQTRATFCTTLSPSTTTHFSTTVKCKAP